MKELCLEIVCTEPEVLSDTENRSVLELLSEKDAERVTERESLELVTLRLDDSEIETAAERENRPLVGVWILVCDGVGVFPDGVSEVIVREPTVSETV